MSPLFLILIQISNDLSERDFEELLGSLKVEKDGPGKNWRKPSTIPGLQLSDLPVKVKRTDVSQRKKLALYIIVPMA
jgi:hypothetical protein